MMSGATIQSVQPELLPLPPVAGAWHCGIVGGRGFFAQISLFRNYSFLSNKLTTVCSTSFKKRKIIFSQMPRLTSKNLRG